MNLDERLEAWRELPAWQHVGAVVAIGALATLRWHHCVRAVAPLIDEATYLAAFRAMADGRSPYDVGSFHYTPFFAWVGSKVVSGFGDAGTIVLLRLSNLLGLAAIVWCSSAWLAVSWRLRLALSAAFVALAPAAGAGLCTGNLSFAVIAIILLALLHWPRHSIALGALPAGVALGSTVAAKPLAPLALVALFFHRPKNPGLPVRRHQIAALAGGLTAALLLAPMLSRLDEMSAQPIHRLSYARSFSLERLLSLVGLEVSALAIVLVGAVLLAVLVRFLRLDRSQLLAVAVTASTLVTPIIWDHTLLMTLPVQVMALSIATERWRSARGRVSRKRAYELIGVALGALAIQLSGGVGAVDEMASAAQAAFISVPLLAPALLAGYVLITTGALAPRNR